MSSSNFHVIQFQHVRQSLRVAKHRQMVLHLPRLFEKESVSEARSEGQHLWSKIFSYKGLLPFLLGAHFFLIPESAED